MPLHALSLAPFLALSPCPCVLALSCVFVVLFGRSVCWCLELDPTKYKEFAHLLRGEVERAMGPTQIQDYKTLSRIPKVRVVAKVDLVA